MNNRTQKTCFWQSLIQLWHKLNIIPSENRLFRITSAKVCQIIERNLRLVLYQTCFSDSFSACHNRAKAFMLSHSICIIYNNTKYFLNYVSWMKVWKINSYLVKSYFKKYQCDQTCTRPEVKFVSLTIFLWRGKILQRTAI